MFRFSLAVALCVTSMAAAQDVSPPPAGLEIVEEAPAATATTTPDLSALDRDTLLALCTQLYARNAELEAKVAELQAKIGGEHGGALATVDGDTSAIPDGSWTVTIVGNTPPDTSRIEDELAIARRPLSGSLMSGLQYRLDSARRRLSEMEAARGYDGKPRYKGRDLDQQRQNVRALENEHRTAQLKVRQLEQQIEAASRERTVSAVTADGIPCTLLIRGANMHLADQLVPEQRYVVTGRGTFGATSGKIVLKSAAPAL